MADDVVEFIQSHGLQRSVLIGHSMYVCDTGTAAVYTQI